MPPKKMKTDGSEATNCSNSSIGCIWKETGPEQKELNRLFEKKLVDESSLPNKVRMTSPMFSKFAAKVFSDHFRKTKLKYGQHCKS